MKKKREQPEFLVQKQYEAKFNTNYQKMLLQMNKAIIVNLTKEK